jgi:hypothetical protein
MSQTDDNAKSDKIKLLTRATIIDDESKRQAFLDMEY